MGARFELARHVSEPLDVDEVVVLDAPAEKLEMTRLGKEPIKGFVSDMVEDRLVIDDHHRRGAFKAVR